jgi:ribosomal protein S18 acetylase RimI-like enzyme
MSTTTKYKFKIASEPWEFEQIYKLSYEAFVEEVPLHDPNPDRTLVDKFHSENTYLICVNDDKILAMVSVRGARPFSLDKKLANIDSYLPPDRSLCEVRLLAARKAYRHSPVVKKLIDETVKFCISQGYDLALISSVLQKQRLYKRLGFVPFGPVVGSDKASLQPMYLTTEAYANMQKDPELLADLPPQQ